MTLQCICAIWINKSIQAHIKECLQHSSARLVMPSRLLTGGKPSRRLTVHCYGDLSPAIKPYDFPAYLRVLKLNGYLKSLKRSYKFQHPIFIIGKWYPFLESNFYIPKVELIPNGSGRLTLTSSENEAGGLSLTEEGALSLVKNKE